MQPSVAAEAVLLSGRPAKALNLRLWFSMAL
jgi:hypothetical protein